MAWHCEECYGETPWKDIYHQREFICPACTVEKPCDFCHDCVLEGV